MKRAHSRLGIEKLEDRTLLTVNVEIIDDTIFVTEDQYEILAVEWDGNIYSVDESTGAATLIGASGFTGLNGLAQSVGGAFFSTSGNTLLIIDPSTGAGTAVATMDVEGVTSLAFSSNGTLFAVVNTAGAHDQLYTIDTLSGEATLIGSMGFAFIQGLDFAADGTLHAWDIREGLMQVDTSTGAATDVDSSVDGGLLSASPQTLVFAPDGTIYGVKEGLNTIDPATGALTFVGTTGHDLRGAEIYSVTPQADVVTIQGISGNRLRIRDGGTIVDTIDLGQFNEGFNIEVDLGQGDDRLVVRDINAGLAQLNIDTGGELGFFPAANRTDNDNVRVRNVQAQQIVVNTGGVSDLNAVSGSFSDTSGQALVIFPLPFQDNDVVTIQGVTTNGGGIEINTGGAALAPPPWPVPIPIPVPGPVPIPGPIVISADPILQFAEVEPRHDALTSEPEVYPLPVRPWFAPTRPLADADKVWVLNSKVNGGDVSIDTGSQSGVGIWHFGQFPPATTVNSLLTIAPEIPDVFPLVQPTDRDTVRVRFTDIVDGDLTIETGAQTRFTSGGLATDHALSIGPILPHFPPTVDDRDFVRVDNTTVSSDSEDGGLMSIRTGARPSGVSGDFTYLGLKALDYDRVFVLHASTESLSVSTGVDTNEWVGPKPAGRIVSDQDRVVLNNVTQVGPTGTTEVYLGDDNDTLIVRNSSFFGDALFSGGDGKDRAVNLDNVFAGLGSFVEFEN